MQRFTITTVILTLGATRAGAQPSADTVVRLDTIAQHLTRIGRAHGEAIWPGFRPDTIPVAFVPSPQHFSGSSFIRHAGPVTTVLHAAAFPASSAAA